MVLSAKWQVSDDDLLDHISALQKGELPKVIPGVAEVAEDVLEDSAGEQAIASEVIVVASSKLPTYKTQPCPQLGLPLKSPRQASSILQSTALSSLSVPSPRGDAFGRAKKSDDAPGLGCSTRLDLLLTHETIPCVNSGRRFNGAPGELIRVYIKMPSIEASISMWVSPHLPVHPMATRASGSAAQTFGATAVTWTVSGHGSPQLSTSLSNSQSPRKTSKSPRRSIWSHTVQNAKNLQSIVEKATGVPVNEQVLRIGPLRLDLNGESHALAGSSLRQCGITHGSQILMHSTSTSVQQHLVQQAQQNRTGEAWVMPRWQYSPKPKIFGQFPDDGYLSTQTPLYHNYCDLRELATDPCDAIRGRFLSTRR